MVKEAVEFLFGAEAGVTVGAWSTVLFPRSHSLSEINRSATWLEIRGEKVPAKTADLAEQARAAIRVKIATKPVVNAMLGRNVGTHRMIPLSGSRG